MRFELFSMFIIQEVFLNLKFACSYSPLLCLFSAICVFYVQWIFHWFRITFNWSVASQLCVCTLVQHQTSYKPKSESSFYVYVQFFVECFRTKTSQCLVKAFSVVSSFMARIHIRLNVSKISESSFYVLECFRNNHSLCLVIWVAQDSVRLAFEILHCLPWSKPRTSLLLVHPGHHHGLLIVLWRFHQQQQSGHVGQ